MSLFSNVQFGMKVEDFMQDENIIFDILELIFTIFFKRAYSDDENQDILIEDVNEFSIEDKIIVMNLSRALYLNYKDTVNQGLENVYITIMFVYYSLVLLEIYGDAPTIVEICKFMKINEESIEWIHKMVNEISFGDDKQLSEIRRFILFP
jgi:hypothetical protein